MNRCIDWRVGLAYILWFSAACGDTAVSPDDGAHETDVEVTNETVVDVTNETDVEVANETDVEVATETDVEVATETDVDTARGSVTDVLAASEDAVASYLLAGFGEWNLFSGTSVPIGRHFDDAHVSYHTAFRFRGVAIPRGAHVTAARLTFFPTNEVDSSNALWIDIYAERSGDSPAFDVAAFDSGRPDQRPHTTAMIDHWLVRCNDACTEATEFDCPQRQRDCWDRAVAFDVPRDLAALVGEVVALPDWSPGNALTLLLVNAAIDDDGAKYRGARSVTTLDPDRGSAFAPTLTITYEVP